MPVRRLESSEISRWIELRADLWPEESSADLDAQGRAALAAEPPLVVFVADENATLVGFLEISLRSYAEGCTGSPVPYVEGWYVSPECRRHGLGGELMDAAAEWSRGRGYTELGSDTPVANRLSRIAHAALGFTEVESLVVFRRAL